MRIRMVLSAAAIVLISACGESATQAPQSIKPGDRLNNTISCRSGYHVATRADGTQYCAPDGPEFSATST